jgi:antibiotic biosynthesis monooxygenase (ABM) superfamily enzyme
MPIAAEFPGHLGANVIRPAAGQNLWSVIIRFDTIEHLYAWTQSETRRQLVAEIAPLLSEGDRPKSGPNRPSGLRRRRRTCASRDAGSSF